MTKQICCYLLFFIAFFLECTDSGAKNVERYVSKEIIIGNYANKVGQPLIGKDGVRWWEIESDHISADDQKRVYVLDAYNSRILQYSQDGVPTQIIKLKNTKIYAGNPDIDDSNTDDSGMDTGIIVSRDGSNFYVITDEYKWTAFNSAGDPIRQKEIIPTTISLNRLCDDKLITNYEVMDAQFNVLSKLTYPLRVQNDYPISENVLFNFSNSTKRPTLIKMNSSRKVIWENKVDRDCIIKSILGLDSSGNIYLLTDKPVGIVKFDNNGSFVTRIAIPKEASDHIKHGIVRGRYHVVCDGSIYYVPPMLYKHDKGFRVFISKGTKSIFKLERVQ